MAALGLSTYRWNNNAKSLLLLAAFPFLLLLLLGGIFFLFALAGANAAGRIDPYTFRSFGLAVSPGANTPWNFALEAIIAYWPIVLGIAVVWVLIGYGFNDVMIHAATGARPVTREE